MTASVSCIQHDRYLPCILSSQYLFIFCLCVFVSNTLIELCERGILPYVYIM